MDSKKQKLVALSRIDVFEPAADAQWVRLPALAGQSSEGITQGDDREKAAIELGKQKARSPKQHRSLC